MENPGRETAAQYNKTHFTFRKWGTRRHSVPQNKGAKALTHMTFIKEGVTRFIFNHKDHREFIYAFCKEDKVFVKNASASVKEVLQEANVIRFYTDIYDFNFGNNKFYYKGKGIYLTDCEKAYLAEWLLNGHKDNKNRMKLCIMRKKFGETFLQDVDRHGQVKEK